MTQITIVCHANVCRSPLAAAILRSAFPIEGEVHVLSAGIEAIEGQQMCSLANKQLGELGSNDHRSLLLKDRLIRTSDLILTMGPEQSALLAARWPQSRERIYSLVQAATSAQSAREQGQLTSDQWGERLPQVLHSFRGLSSVPALRDPRRFRTSFLEPGRIPDGHGLPRVGHQRVLQYVAQYTRILANVR